MMSTPRPVGYVIRYSVNRPHSYKTSTQTLVTSLIFVMFVMRHSDLSVFWHHVYTWVELSVDITDCCYALVNKLA